jgi:hypothetical protein
MGRPISDDDPQVGKCLPKHGIQRVG